MEVKNMVKTFKEDDVETFESGILAEILRRFHKRYGDEKVHDSMINRRAFSLKFRLMLVELLKAISLLEDDPKICKKADRMKDDIYKEFDIELPLY